MIYYSLLFVEAFLSLNFFHKQLPKQDLNTIYLFKSNTHYGYSSIKTASSTARFLQHVCCYTQTVLKISRRNMLSRHLYSCAFRLHSLCFTSSSCRNNTPIKYIRIWHTPFILTLLKVVK